MLWGAAAASVPIALHFFFRSRYRTVPWAAMKYLLLSIEQTSRRLKFQELLLLIVRCAVLVLLAVALARPLFSSVSTGGREAVDAVFVFDTSYSMGAREGKQLRLDFAKSAALAVMDHLPAHSTVQIVTCSDKAILLGPREPDKLDLARDLIKQLELTHLATDMAPGVVEAVEALKRGNSPNKELYLFSDMQKLGFEQNAGTLTTSLKALSAKATVYMVRCGSQNPRNVAVVGIAPQSGIPRPGERVGFAVLVRNTGTVKVQNLRVALSVDGKEKQPEEQPIDKLEPGETRALTLTTKLDKAGLRVLTATVKYDDLDADNRYDQVILVRDQVRVLVIDGALDAKEPRNSSSYYLMHALLPVKEELRAKYHVRTTLLTPRQASAAELNRHDICILVNTALERTDKRTVEVPPADFLQQLPGWVSKGNGLIVLGGENVAPRFNITEKLLLDAGVPPAVVAKRSPLRNREFETLQALTQAISDLPPDDELRRFQGQIVNHAAAADPYNRILGKQLGLLPLKLTGTTKYPPKTPMTFNRDSIEGANFLRFKEDEYYKGLSQVGALRTLDLEETPQQLAKESGPKPNEMKADPTRVLMRYSNGKPALVSRTVDGGEVLLLATAVEPAWSELPFWLGYHPFVEASLNHLSYRQTQSHNFTAGETLRWSPDPRDAGRSFVLEHPPEKPGESGKREPLGRPDTVQGRPVVTATGLQRAGIYHLTAADRGEGGAAEAAKQKRFQPVPFAVVPDLRESASLETLSDEQINERLGFRPVHLKSDGNVNVTAETERTNREWTLWLLVAVLVLAVGETVLAWFCGRAW